MQVDPIETYLATNIDQLDLIIHQVVSLLPDAYFYKSELRSTDFVARRQSLDLLSQKSRSLAYKGDKSIKYTYKKEVKDYEIALAKEAEKQRSNFLTTLLSETDDVKAACLYNLISYYRLLKHLRTFNR
ncbi:hypothetical protein ACVRZR_06475 [Streptococcus entericus]